MGFESRHRNDDPSREELAETLARAHRLEVERARDVLRRAEQAAAEDPQARSVRQWFAILVEDGGDAVGKRRAIEAPEADRAARRHEPRKPAPGRQTLVRREERPEEAASRAPGRDEPNRSAQRLYLVTQWRLSKAQGCD